MPEETLSAANAALENIDMDGNALVEDPAASDVRPAPSHEPEPAPAPEPTPAPEPEPGSEPAPGTESTDVEEYDSWADALKAQGIEGHDSIKSYVDAQNQALGQLREALAIAGLKTEAQDIASLAEHVVNHVRTLSEQADDPGAQKPPGQQQPPVPALSLDEVFNKFADKLDISGDGKEFHTAYANAIHNSVAKAVNDQLTQITRDVASHVKNAQRQTYMLRQVDRAIAAAGEGPIPSEAEIMRALMPAPGQYSEAAKTDLFYWENGLSAQRNAATDVIQQFRQSKLPGGMTEQQRHERDEQARKLALHKKTIKATPAPRHGAKPFSQMTSEERDAALDAMGSLDKLR